MSTQPNIDVVHIMQEIRSRAIAKRTGSDPTHDPVSMDNVFSFARLNDLLLKLRGICTRLDDLPPQPPTLRGRVGSLLAKVVRRSLFWQYMQAGEFSRVTTSILDDVCAAVEDNHRATRSVRDLASATRKEADRSMAALQDAEVRLEQFESRVAAAEARLAQVVAQTANEASAVLARIDSQDNRLGTLQARVEQLAPHGIDETRMALLEKEIAAIDIYSRQTRREAMIQSARIESLSRRTQLADRTPSEVNSGGQPTGAMESLYLAFEDAYRGDPGEITRRLAAYVPVLNEYGITPELGPALDIGCGRGEWLDILITAGFTGKGCDTNVHMVETCRHRGLQVELTDGLSYLRSLPNTSLSIVSAMHVIEHLPIETLLALLDASLAALKPGGILILESPNPQNILVGAHNFYLDPTHERPLPMQLTEFLVESRGFCAIRAFGLNPYPNSFRLDEHSPVAQRFNEYFYGPQDYAVVARRI